MARATAFGCRQILDEAQIFPNFNEFVDLFNWFLG
jgi:tRNA C32,U32 (ribose-2'-O)-methylase TrmJ